MTTRPDSQPKRLSLYIGRLLWWSMLQPTRLNDHLATLHPTLTVQTGFSRFVWLARNNKAVRRILGIQLLLWLMVSWLGMALYLAFAVLFAPNTVNADSIFFSLLFAFGFGLAVGAAVVVTLGVAAGFALSAASLIATISALLIGAIIAQFVDIGTVSDIVIGLIVIITISVPGPAVDQFLGQTLGLSRLRNWGRVIVGGIPVLTLFLIFYYVGATNYLGPIAGLAVLLLIMVTVALDRLNQEHHRQRKLSKWLVIDSLLLALSLTAAIGLSAITGEFAIGVIFGILFGVIWGTVVRVGNSLAAIFMMTAAAGVATYIGIDNGSPVLTMILMTGAVFLIGLTCYVRLPLVIFEILWTWWAYWQANNKPDQALTWLRRSPVYWDDLIFYPLPLLDRLLLLVLHQHKETGLREVAFVAHSGSVLEQQTDTLTWVTRPFQKQYIVNRVRLNFASEILSNCRSTALIATAQTELDWLADETMVDLGEGTAEVVPRLLRIANGIKATLTADNPYSQRLGYREALEGLDTLQTRLSSLGKVAKRRWQPVISSWQNVLLNALDDISTAITPTSTENPYQPGNPLQLVRKALFKGRQTLRDVVINALLEHNRPTLVLHGPRRMGKTSFLLQLPALLPGNTLPVFLDLQRPAVTQSTAAFLYHIARAISRDARPYRFLIDPPQRNNFESAPFESFADWLEDSALPILKEFNLLLTFDEFEKLGEAVQTGRLDTQIFDELRYLIQHQTQLALLFAGVQALDELGPAWSSYFINVKPLTIGYLSPSEAEELIRQPDPGADFRLTYSDSVVADILELTHRQPYLLQLVCSSVVEECNIQQTLHASGSILEAALIRALDQGEPYFRNVWDEMAGGEGQPLLRQIAQSTTPLALPHSPPLAHLLRRRVITKCDGDAYIVEVPLVRRWVIERAP